MQARLTIEVSGDVSDELAASQTNLAVAHSARGPAGPDVLWLSFSELLETDIVVEWDTSAFAIYMTETLPDPGFAIHAKHPFSAELGWTYTFDGDGFFGVHDGPADVCTIINEKSASLYFGLAYRANVNGRSILAPISVAQLQNGRGELAPGDELTILLTFSPYSGSIINAPTTRRELTVKPDADLVFDEIGLRLRGSSM